MNLSNVNIGTGPSAGDGDPIRTAFGIVNNNFAYIQSNINSLTNSVTTVAGRTGNVILTVNDIVGLSNAYAISSATTTANTGMRGYVDTTVAANIAALINGAPGALDTIQELAAALGNNASYAATITNSLASTNSNITLANTVMRGYVDGQISAANSVPNTANIGMKGYVDNAVSTANLGIKGYVDQANTIQSAQITTANLGIKGYIDLANTIQSAQITAGNLGIIGYVNSQVTAANVAWQANSLTQSVLINSLNTAFVNLAANAEIQQGNIYSLETSIATVNNSISLGNTIQSAQIASANVGVIGYIGQQITTANVGIKGYIDLANTTQQSLITTANVGIIGYIDRGNTIVTAGITTANLGMIGYVDNKVSTANIGIKGYIDLGNTIQTAQMTAANLGMKGYVDSVATLSIYSNVNAKAYTESMGFSNYGNSNVRSYFTGGFDGNILPSANVTYSLGTPTQQWKDLYVSNNTIYISGTPLSSTPGGLTFAGVPVSSFSPTSATTVTPGTVWNFANTVRATSQLVFPAYGSGKFVIVESGTYGGQLTPNIGMYSTDGATWTTMYLPNVATQVQTIAYGAGKFVVAYSGGAAGSGPVAYSEDGINWTLKSNAIPYVEYIGSPGSNLCAWTKTGAAYGNGRFVLLSGLGPRTVISTDGITWSNGSAYGSTLYGSSNPLPLVDGQGYSLYWDSLTFDNGWFVASAQRQSAGGANTFAYSSDGINWTGAQLSTGAVPGSSSYYLLGSGGGVFIAVLGTNTTSGIGLRSTDNGRTWSNITLPSTYTYTSVTYGGGAFILTPGGQNGAYPQPGANIAISTDGGITWANVATPYNAYNGGGAYGAGTFIAAGNAYGNVLNVSYSTSVGALTLAPTLPGTIDRVDIGTSTPGAGAFTSLSADSISTSGDISAAGNITVLTFLKGLPGGNLTISSPTVVTGNVTANYFVGNGSLLTALPGYAYSNVNVAALITTNGLTNYSNVNVKAYTETMGYQNYGNVNVAAYVTTANSAVIGYIDQANSIQSAQVNAANLAIIAANLGMKGYVDSVASQSIYGNGNVKSYLTQFDGNIIPSANVIYSLGNVTNRWKDLYLSGNTIFLGDSTISTEGGRLVTTGVAISPPTGAVGFANVQYEAPTDFAQIRSYYVDNNFGYTANLKSWATAPIVWDELRSSKIKINSNFVSGNPSDFASLDTSGGRFANAIATLDATGNIASLTITDGGVGYDSYYPYYATDSTGYDNNYIGQPFNSGSPTGKSFRRIGLIPTTATNVGNITSIGSFTRYSGLPTVGTNTYHWIGNTGSNVSITINWASNTVTSYTYIPALPALTSANDWQNWLLDYQATNNYGWIIGSGSITGGGGSTIQAVYDYLNREALPNSLTYDLSNTTWYPGNLLVNNSATIATLSSQTFFVNFNRTAIGYATVENSYGNPVYWLRGLTADSGISTGGDMTVAGDLRVAGDLFVSPTSIYMGNLRISAADGNLTVNTAVKFSDGSVQSSAYSNVKVKAYTESMGFQNYGNVNVAALITTNGLTNYSNVNVIAYLAGNITVGNIAGSVNGYSIGYRDAPQITVANLTLIASDAGKHYYGANTNPTTITIPTNANVAFGNGTAISIVNQGTGNITVANAAGVALYLAGNSTAGSRVITSYGMATLIKVQVNTWFINGTGVV